MASSGSISPSDWPTRITSYARSPHPRRRAHVDLAFSGGARPIARAIASAACVVVDHRRLDLAAPGRPASMRARPQVEAPRPRRRRARGRAIRRQASRPRDELAHRAPIFGTSRGNENRSRAESAPRDRLARESARVVRLRERAHLGRELPGREREPVRARPRRAPRAIRRRARGERAWAAKGTTLAHGSCGLAVGAVVLREDGAVLLLQRARRRRRDVDASRRQGRSSRDARASRSRARCSKRRAFASCGRDRRDARAPSRGLRVSHHGFLVPRGGSDQARAADDALAARWVLPHELGSLGLTPEVLRVIARARTLG